MYIYVCVVNASFQAYHFFDLSLGGGLRGIKNRALIGCMSHKATNKDRETVEQMGEGTVKGKWALKKIHAHKQTAQ